MGNKETIFSGAKITWIGIVDLKLFYKKLQEFLKIKKYGKIAEKRYSEKVKPNGKQIEFVWECKREDVQYFVFTINLKFLLIGVTEADIEKDGRKLKLNKIDATIEIDSFITKDPKGEWKEKAPFWKKLYEKYIIGQQIEDAKIECYKDTTALIEEIKDKFEMYSLK